MVRIPIRVPNLAWRAADLKAMALPNATCTLQSGKELIYRFRIAPSPASRVYECALHVKPGKEPPDMIVISPDLKELAGIRSLPHTYIHDKTGTKLCLWRPRYGEWQPSMRLSETYIPWTAEWLLYFEHWLANDEWAGGGEHPSGGNSKPLTEH